MKRWPFTTWYLIKRKFQVFFYLVLVNINKLDKVAPAMTGPEQTYSRLQKERKKEEEKEKVTGDRWHLTVKGSPVGNRPSPWQIQPLSNSPIFQTPNWHCNNHAISKCHTSGVTCQMSGVRCQVACVRCHNFISIFFSFFGQSGGASRLRVCYQGGLHHRVSLFNDSAVPKTA